MGWVQSGRWMDSKPGGHEKGWFSGGVMALFLMCISAASLHLFSHLWNIAQKPEFVQWKVGKLLKTLFHINKTFDFNLTHVMLMAIIICLLSLRPDFELKESLDDKKKKNKKSTAAATESAASESSL